MTDSKERDKNKTPGISPTNAIISNRYQLRHAAGIYWLLDMEQSGMPYVKPVPINEIGADIWELYVQGIAAEEIAERLGSAYGVSAAQVKEDVCTFLDGLKEQGVVL